MPTPFKTSSPVIAGLALLITLLACATRPIEADPTGGSPTATWRCRNDLEVRCAEGTCKAEGTDAFTPMDVRVDDSGAMSVCAYSGCWEGTGEVLRSEGFLVWVGHDLELSTSPGPESRADILVALDLTDGVATLKAGVFAHPLLCDPEERLDR